MALHGAMFAESYPDCEDEILSSVRAVVGSETPIAVSLDCHANVTDRVSSPPETAAGSHLSSALGRSPRRRRAADQHVIERSTRRLVGGCIPCRIEAFGGPHSWSSMVVNIDNIKGHDQVVGADGVHVGTVDHVQGERIKLTRQDSVDQEHHFIPVALVASVEDNVVTVSANADIAIGFEEPEPQ